MADRLGGPFRPVPMTGVTADVVRETMGFGAIARIAALVALVPLGGVDYGHKGYGLALMVLAGIGMVLRSERATA